MTKDKETRLCFHCGKKPATHKCMCGDIGCDIVLCDSHKHFATNPARIPSVRQ